MNKKFTTVMGLVFIGALWGILEATMGNILHWIGLHPYTGAVMTSIGLGFLTFGRKLYHKKGSSILLGVIAAGIKSLDIFVPGSNVLRPVVAILLVAITHEVVMIVTDKLKETNWLVAARGLVAGYVSLTGFVFTAAYILHYKYWLSMGVGGLFQYLLAHGWYFGLGSMLLMLAGQHLVLWGNKKISLERVVYTKPYANASLVGTFLVIVLAFFV